ncbi:MAG: DUF1499 domain-containing protein [Cyanobacteria bacterium J083]|nr:MAG: DUF1499 domain-containing protein [Cyanobacteria bacterium J083]
MVLTSFVVFPPNSWAISTSSDTTIAALPLISNFAGGKPPQNLGVKGGHLSQCPDSPNCVVSQGGDSTHSIKPIVYQQDREVAREILLKVLSVVPRTKVVSQTDEYIRVEFTSNLMGFVDDGEFYFPPASKVIHIRSAARVGESDFGLNRRRLEQIRLALADLEA